MLRRSEIDFCWKRFHKPLSEAARVSQGVCGLHLLQHTKDRLVNHAKSDADMDTRAHAIRIGSRTRGFSLAKNHRSAFFPSMQAEEADVE